MWTRDQDAVIAQVCATMHLLHDKELSHDATIADAASSSRQLMHGRIT